MFMQWSRKQHGQVGIDLRRLPCKLLAAGDF